MSFKVVPFILIMSASLFWSLWSIIIRWWCIHEVKHWWWQLSFDWRRANVSRLLSRFWLQMMSPEQNGCWFSRFAFVQLKYQCQSSLLCFSGISTCLLKPPKNCSHLLWSRLQNPPCVPCCYSFLTQCVQDPLFLCLHLLYHLSVLPHLLWWDPPSPPAPVLPCCCCCFNGADNAGLRRDAPQLWDTRAFWKAGLRWLTNTL